MGVTLYRPRVRADSVRLSELIRFAAIQFKENGWVYSKWGTPLAYYSPSEADLEACVNRLLTRVRERGNGWTSSGRWCVSAEEGDGHVWVIFLGDDEIGWPDDDEWEVPA